MERDDSELPGRDGLEAEVADLPSESEASLFNGFGSLWGSGVKESLRRASGVALLEARR